MTQWTLYKDWDAILGAAEQGRLYYKAPMDAYPRLCRVTRRGRGRKLRVIPGPGADPFWANSEHYERFVRPDRSSI